MAVKTITVTEQAYKALAGDKNKDESFSEVILRTHKRKGNVEDIMKFSGAWSDMSDEEADEILKNINKLNKGAWRSIKHKVKGM
ncbi:antitoxin VapB family protein [Candidatus Woesearchaeota archaeon]|nr:antitoxin VapB family protein [Candidatus Woesearchaeota archaeon]